MTLSVRNKLIMLAGLSILGIGLLTASSHFEMARIYTAASYANDHTVPALVALDDAQNALAVQRSLSWQILLQTDATEVARLNREMQDARQKIKAAFEVYEPRIVSDKDRGMLADDQSAFSAFDVVLDSALGLARDGQKNEARDLLNENEVLIKGATDAIEAHRQYNKELGAAGAAEGVRVKSAALRIEIAIGFIIGGLVLGVAFVVIRSLTRALSQAVAVLAEIERGNYESSVTIMTKDETGQVLASLDAMQRSLKERTERDRERAQSDRERAAGDRVLAGENARIRNALDRVSVGAMLADADGKIIYLNDAMQALMRVLAGHIRKQQPQLDPERILGNALEVFPDVPIFQRNQLAALSAAHTADFKLGEASLRIVANPVVDADAKRVGTIVQWFDRTQEVAIEEEVQATVAGAIDGDLTVRIREDGKEGFFKTLAGGMNRLVGNMAEVLLAISTVAAEVGTGAEEISRGNTDLSQRTEEQASSLEETASSMEQMTSAVKHNADNAAQANQLARAARDHAEQAGAVVQSAITAMSEINGSSKKIADIIGVIDAIAFQTNLLALNAAVEAARAGEQGRGFAVVASEVRNLASRSAAAAKEIKSLIHESVTKADDGTKLVDASGRVLQEIVAGVKKVTDVIAEIAASSQEQASGIEQVNKAVMSMDEVTQQNAALVEEAAAAAESLTEQAANLTQLMARFHVGEDRARARATRTPRPVAEPRTPARASSGAKPASQVASNAPRRKVAVGDTGADWQQF